MKIMSFIGPKTSGKDTCADLVIKKGISCGKVSFAEPLKEICSKVFDIPLEDTYDQTKKEILFDHPKYLTEEISMKILEEVFKRVPNLKNSFSIDLTDIEGTELTSIRDILQFIGTEFMRHKINYDIHLMMAFAGIKGSGVLCSVDTRFKNEFDFLETNYDLETYYVERPEAEAILSKATHKSELELLELRPRCKYIIENNGTLEDLEKKLFKLIK